LDEESDMKVLMGYDGSHAGTVALDDLHRACLPGATELRIVTVWDTAWNPPPSMYEVLGLATDSTESSLGCDAPALRGNAYSQALDTATRAVTRVRLEQPNWTLHAEALAGDPAAELVRTADDWGADLIVVGSRGRSGLERLLLGSVSRKVLTGSGRSVRVVRRALGTEGNASVQILVGVDGRPGSEHAVRAVAARTWPAGSSARVVAVEEGAVTASSVGAALSSAAYELWAAGLDVSVTIRRGAAAHVLANEAREWGADCVFVGSRAFTSEYERWRLGSVSTALAESAPCSVEVVRPRIVDDQTAG
jgi:nucleotide-binding universal stress UspA family protein